MARSGSIYWSSGNGLWVCGAKHCFTERIKDPVNSLISFSSHSRLPSIFSCLPSSSSSFHMSQNPFSSVQFSSFCIFVELCNNNDYLIPDHFSSPPAKGSCIHKHLLPSSLLLIAPGNYSSFFFLSFFGTNLLPISVGFLFWTFHLISSVGNVTSCDWLLALSIMFPRL